MTKKRSKMFTNSIKRMADDFADAPGRRYVGSVDTARLDRDIAEHGIKQSRREAREMVSRISARFAPKKV